MPNCRSLAGVALISINSLVIPGSRSARPGMTIYVSTSPVLDPLAAESFRPCGSAR